MVDLAVSLLALASFVGVVTIVARRFPTLAAIDTTSIPVERQGKLKTRLIEQRLKRKVELALRALLAALRPMSHAFTSFLRQRYERLLALERQYRTRVTTPTALSPEEREKKDFEIDRLLTAAHSALDRGAIEEAERDAIDVIAKDPRNVRAYRVLASVYLENKDYEHARETLEFIIQRLHVEDDEVYAELGQVDSGEGKLEEAKRDLEKSIAVNSQAAEHFLDLCRVNLALGDTASAFESCKRAVEIEPNNPKFLDALVETSIVSGKREWASETLEKLRAVNPENQKLEEFQARIANLPKKQNVRPRSHKLVRS